jgi:hypothetical protein
MSDLAAKQLENAHAFLTYLNALNWDRLGELLAPNFRHKYLPATIIPPDGKEDRGKDEFVGVLKYNFEKVFDKVTVRTSSRSVSIFLACAVTTVPVFGAVRCHPRHECGGIPRRCLSWAISSSRLIPFFAAQVGWHL